MMSFDMCSWRCGSWSVRRMFVNRCCQDFAFGWRIVFTSMPFFFFFFFLCVCVLSLFLSSYVNTSLTIQWLNFINISLELFEGFVEFTDSFRRWISYCSNYWIWFLCHAIMEKKGSVSTIGWDSILFDASKPSTYHLFYKLIELD